MSNENIDIITLANRVANEKENIRKAIENRGVSIPETTPLNQYPAKIMAIDTENVATDVYFAGDQDESGPNMLFNGNYGIISPGALESNQEIETVDFNNVSTVGDTAFEDCTNLASFTGDHLKYVGNNAFHRTGLTSLNNSHIEYIGSGAFSDCGSLSTVNTHEAKLDSSAFQNCNNMTSFTSNAEVIPSDCCYSAGNLTSLSIPSAKTIGNHAFYYMGSTAYNADNSTRYAVSLPEATSVNSYAFYNCAGLNSFSAPKVTRLADYSLQYSISRLNSLDISNVEYIGNYVFNASTYMPAVQSSGLNIPKCSYIGDYNFNKNYGSYDEGFFPELVVSNSGCTIGKNTFYYNVPRITVGKVTDVGEQSYFGIPKTTSTNRFEFPFETLRSAGRRSFYQGAYDLDFYVANNSMDFSMATHIGTGAGYDYAAFSNTNGQAPSKMHIEKIWVPSTCTNFYTFLGGMNASNPIHVYTDAAAGKSSWTFCTYASTDSRFTTGTSSPYVIIHYGTTHEDFENGTYNS